ncbi:MAG: hypothetical protein ACTSRZ_12220 [Promethearchaeota archaeon]
MIKISIRNFKAGIRVNKLSKYFIKLMILFLLLFTIGLSIYQAAYAQEGEGNNYLKEGEWIKYSWKGTKAYIPYAASSIYVVVVNASNPDNIIINITRNLNGDAEDVLNESISAGTYILNNNTLTYNWSVCPNNIADPSEIRNHWNETYLNNISEVYYDVKRETIELKYEQNNIVLGGYNHNISVRWVWDKYTGVLLNNTVYFNNLDDPALSGSLEQYLDETSLWSLTTGGIPGFNIFYLLISSLMGGATVIIILIKHNHNDANIPSGNKKRIKIKTSLNGGSKK